MIESVKAASMYMFGIGTGGGLMTSVFYAPSTGEAMLGGMVAVISFVAAQITFRQ